MHVDITPPAPSSRPQGRTSRSNVRTLLSTPEATLKAFREHWGHAALLHLPPDELVERALLRFGHAATRLATSGRGSANQALLMLRAFRDMEIDFISGLDDACIIGRAPGVQLMMADESVSKKHASLRWSSHGVWLADLQSLNGTQLNGSALNGTAKLEDGDLIRLGDANLVFVTCETLFLQLESVRHSSHGAH